MLAEVPLVHVWKFQGEECSVLLQAHSRKYYCTPDTRMSTVKGEHCEGAANTVHEGAALRWGSTARQQYCEAAAM